MPKNIHFLAIECENQMSHDTGPDFKFEIGQKIQNEQIGEIKIYDRWHGKNINFYDIYSEKKNFTWTFDENEVITGHKIHRKA